MGDKVQPGADLPLLERVVIDNATYDGRDWIVATVVSDKVLEQMASKGLITLEPRHWRLTPLGYACSAYASILYS